MEEYSRGIHFLHTLLSIIFAELIRMELIFAILERFASNILLINMVSYLFSCYSFKSYTH